MKINTVDKTEKLALGSIYELRGNFEEIINEDGDVSYSCDMYRTKNSSKTFDELDTKYKKQEALDYLSSTDWIYAKCIEEGLNAIDVYPEIVAKRKQARSIL